MAKTGMVDGDRTGAGPGSSETGSLDHQTLAVIDVGSSSIRLVVAETTPDGQIKILEEASRGVLLGKDTFSRGRITRSTLEVTLKAIEGFRRIMESYGVSRCRAVATNAVREATNREIVLDRIRLRTGIDVEVIDGSEENRLTYMAVRDALGDHEALKSGTTLLVEVGGGNADISFLHAGVPTISGNYPIGAIRMRQTLGSWHGPHAQRVRLLERYIRNVVQDIRRQIPLAEASHFIALGGDVRFAAARILGAEAPEGSLRVLEREAFNQFCSDIGQNDVDQLVEKYGLTPADAETLVPALLASRELLGETAAKSVMVPEVSLRTGLLLDARGVRDGAALSDYRRQVLSSATALGRKYHYNEAHAETVARLAVSLFEQLRTEHGLDDKDCLLLEVAGLLHDIGIYISLRTHHKHSHYILSSSEVFGLSQDDLAVVANVARYHRRALPQKSHLSFMSLDRDARVKINKLAALLRLANALDADHMQKVKSVRVIREDDIWILEVEGEGDLTMERLATLARADLFSEVFGQKISFREKAVQP